MNNRSPATTLTATSPSDLLSPTDEEPGSINNRESHSISDDSLPIAAAKKTVLQGSPRAALWAGVPDEQWDDWRWQLANRLNSLEDLSQIINLTDEEVEGLTAENKFRVDVIPYFASLIDPDDPHCPIRRQVIPLGRELQAFEGMMEDSLAEDAHSPVPGLVHRYPDRVLMLITTQCASYCRYCTRSRIVGSPHENFSKTDFEAQLDYLRKTPQVRDVLISGGDPLTLAPKTLEYIVSNLRAIEHIEIIRIGSRVPVFLPQRITDEFCNMLRQYHPVWLNIHVNHPKEITPELSRALAKLADSGFPIGNQTVLLAGINDSINIQRELAHKLVKNRVRPYYLYQCDLVKGAGHFRTTVAKGIEIIEGMRGHTSGYAVPTYVVDAPGGGGKIPVMPQYLISQAPGRVVLRNYEGYIATYEEPTDYDSGMIEHLDREAPRRSEPGQSGVAGLLAGDGMAIKPQGFDDLHKRGAEQHRLNSDASKWVPYHERELPVTSDQLPERSDNNGNDVPVNEQGTNGSNGTAQHIANSANGLNKQNGSKPG